MPHLPKLCVICQICVTKNGQKCWWIQPFVKNVIVFLSGSREQTTIYLKNVLQKKECGWLNFLLNMFYFNNPWQYIFLIKFLSFLFNILSRRTSSQYCEFVECLLASNFVKLLMYFGLLLSNANLAYALNGHLGYSRIDCSCLKLHRQTWIYTLQMG